LINREERRWGFRNRRLSRTSAPLIPWQFGLYEAWAPVRKYGIEAV
jgi:hypothetical protein